MQDYITKGVSGASAYFSSPEWAALVQSGTVEAFNWCSKVSLRAFEYRAIPHYNDLDASSTALAEQKRILKQHRTKVSVGSAQK